MNAQAMLEVWQQTYGLTSPFLIGVSTMNPLSVKGIKSSELQQKIHTDLYD